MLYSLCSSNSFLLLCPFCWLRPCFCLLSVLISTCPWIYELEFRHHETLLYGYWTALETEHIQTCWSRLRWRHFFWDRWKNPPQIFGGKPLETWHKVSVIWKVTLAPFHVVLDQSFSKNIRFVQSPPICLVYSHVSSLMFMGHCWLEASWLSRSLLAGSQLTFHYVLGLCDKTWAPGGDSLKTQAKHSKA